MGEYPAAEECLRRGDWAGARDAVPRCVELPALRELDAWVLELWEEMRSTVAEGERLRVLRMRCRAEGLTAAAEVEVWRRVALVDLAVRSYLVGLAEMEMEARRG